MLHYLRLVLLGKSERVCASLEILLWIHQLIQIKHCKFVHHLIYTEKAEFFNALTKCEGAKPAVLANVPPYCEAYIPASLDQDLPVVLSELRRKEYLRLEYRSLLQLASETEVQVTAYQAKAVEAKTRDQAKSRIWLRMRAGRITASI